MKILVVFLMKPAKTLKNHCVFHQNRWKSSTFDENPCRFLRKTQKSEKSITFCVKNCKIEALLMRILGVFSIFDSRNPRGTYFPPASLRPTRTPTYYLDHENPYQHSCWGITCKPVRKICVFCFQMFLTYFSRYFKDTSSTIP